MSGDEQAPLAAFGQLLRRFRHESGLSQEELGERAGVGVRTIADLERGRRSRRPYRRTVVALAKALNLRGAELNAFVRLARAGQDPMTADGDGQAGPGECAGPPTVEPTAEQGGMPRQLRAEVSHFAGQAGAACASETLRQLPPPVPHFAGRAAELRDLTELPASGRQALLAVVDGTAGVGKTALAIHWAHQASASFPDGQMYLNLNGFGPAGKPMTPMASVSSLLEALGVPPARTPSSLEGRTALYRSLLAERRMLIVLDNARDADQVRPLLPGGSGCMVLVTSRSRLTGLIALDGSWSLTLGLLTLPDARQMVAQRLGAGPTAADPGATDRLIEACSRLPLALAIAAALIATRPGYSIATAACELAPSSHRLDALDAGEARANVRAVFAWSYQALTPRPASMFCLMAEHPGPDITMAAAASLAGTTQDEAWAALAELTAANLVAEHSAGRFGFHDLLRQFAADQLRASHCPPERRAAAQRMLGHYTHTATSAALAISPKRELPRPRPPVAGTRPEAIAGPGEALDWLRAEYAVILRALAYAAGAGEDVHVVQLAFALTDFQERSGHWHDWAASQRMALTAATKLGDVEARAKAHRYIGRATFFLEQHDEALSHLTRAFELRHQQGAPAAEAGICLDLCRLHQQRGATDAALRLAQQALGLYQASQHKVGEAYALNSIGCQYVGLGMYPEALDYGEQALRLSAEVESKVGQSQALDTIGFARYCIGQPALAIVCYQKSIEILCDLGDRYQISAALTHLGDAYTAAGVNDDARRAWREAVTILDELGHSDAIHVREKLMVLQEQVSPPGRAVVT